MSSVPFPRAVVAAVTILVVAGAALFAIRPAPVAHASTMIELNNPLQQDGLNPDVAFAIDAIQNEAGISAWFNVGAPVNLDSVVSRYRTVEMRTSTYIIGSAALPGYDERHDVHVYIHKDGWFLAYYLKTDPVAKMVDIEHYPDQGLNTKFETILAEFADAAGVSFQAPKFWDFRYPNANRIMIVAEDTNNGDNFTIKLPSAYLFFERSLALDDGGNFVLDGVSVLDCGGPCESSLTATQLAVDVTHTVVVGRGCCDVADAALVLTYKQP